MNTSRRQHIVGLILAGGGGQRLGGVRKLDLRFGNLPLLAHVHKALAHQCAPILLSVAFDRRRSASGMIVLPDAADGITGPAAGLLAAARWCDQNCPGALLVSVSVDTPFFPDDFGQRAIHLLKADHGCVVAAYDGRDYPTNALWRPDRLLAQLASMPPGPRGPRLRDVQAALKVKELDYSRFTAENPFFGVNRLADLLTLQGRLHTLVP